MGSAFIRESAFENLAKYSWSAKWAAGRTLIESNCGGLKSMIFFGFGGQQFMGGGPQLSMSGARMVARVEASVVVVEGGKEAMGLGFAV